MSNPVGTQSLPPFVIQEFDLDEKYGFELEVIPFSNTNAAIAAVQGESTDLTVFDWMTIARMRNAGVRVIGVAPFLDYVNGVVVPTDSPVQSLADLRGKRIGTYSVGGFDWVMMRAVAGATYGFDLVGEGQIQEGAPSLLRGILEQGQLDATLMYNSMIPDMIVDGKYRVLFYFRDLMEEMGLPPSPFVLYAAREGYAEENPENVRAFTAAYREAIEILRTNDDVWTAQGENMRMSPEALLLFRDSAREEILTEFTPEMNEALNQTFEVMYEVAGAEILGFSEMPDRIITLDYQ